MDWTQIVIAAISGGTLMKVLDYLLGGKRKNDIEILHGELSRLSARLTKLERQVERYELREAIFSSATSCAHKCSIPDEKCPVLKYMDGHPLPNKSIEE